jgi:chromate reductase
MLRVLGIAGSLRSGSYNRVLLRATQELAPGHMQITLFDLAPIPPYNSDVEAQGEPASVVALKSAIREADAVLIATPEYNRSIPGVVKNALDWASRPPTRSVLDGKPVAVMGASTGSFGTVRPQAHLQELCVAANMLAMNRPQLFVAHAKGKFDDHGQLVDQDTRERLAKLLDALADWILLLQKRRVAV